MLAACQATSCLLEHCHLSGVPVTTHVLCPLTRSLSELVLLCGTCPEVLPAAPRALEALVAGMQQVQVGRASWAGWVDGLLGWGGQFAQRGASWRVTLNAPPHGGLAAR